MRTKIIYPLIFVILVLAVTGCAGQPAAYSLAPESELPAFLDNSPAEFRQAYRFAIANPHELEKYPCYCGCVYMNHADNRQCYIRSIARDGTIKFDEHASVCQICIDITLDVMHKLEEGEPSKAIRAYIDEKYSKSGPPTDTALPS